MLKFSFPFGIKPEVIRPKFEHFFMHLKNNKENKIAFSKEPPEDPEQGDLWIDFSVKPEDNTPKLFLMEFPIRCNIKQYSEERFISIHSNIDTNTFSDTEITLKTSLDGKWIGYLQGNYGRITNPWFLGGRINWFAVNVMTHQIWFEALEEYVHLARKVILTFENGMSLEYDGFKNGLKTEEGFFNDYEINSDLARYLIPNLNKKIRVHIDILR